jgi:hypothetical protein
MAVLGSTTLTGCNSIPDFIGTGTLMLFEQTNAPLNWVKQTSHNDKMLRLVDGTVSSGGSISFSSAFPNSTIPISASSPYSVTVGNHTLSTTEIPSHSHADTGSAVNVNRANGPGARRSYIAPVPNTGAEGGSGAHAHPWGASSVSVSTTLDLRVQYVDVIICSKS